jgi:dihydroneopterin aldolase
MFPSGAIVRPSKWQATLAMADITDNIVVRNLHMAANAGVDAWGRPKPQPSLLTVVLHLAKPFDSAATADALDESTVNYGVLSKNIRSGIENGIGHVSTEELAAHVYTRVLETAGKTDLKAVEIDVFYPKASLLGDGAGYSISSFTNSGHGEPLSRVVYLRNVRIPCIIGVNANERRQKQPVVVNLWIECLSTRQSESYTRFENVLVDVGYLRCIVDWC